MRPWITRVDAKAAPVEVYRSLLLEKSNDDKGTIYAHNVHGYGSEEVIEKVIKSEIDAHCVFSLEDPESETTKIYALGSHGFLQVIYADNHVDFSIQSLYELCATSLAAKVRKELSEAPVRGTVHMLAFEQSFYLTELGEIDHPLQRENYTQETLEKYDRVIEDLLSDSPTGRLTLLDGEPGTGKSYIVRGVISAVSALFIYVPASVAGKMTGPDIVPVIMREKDKDVPIVMIMEDADSSLTTRQMDNVSRLSDLLNMSDGILGDMSDLRIVATTNSKKSEIDRAVMRHGRMNEHIELGLLDQRHAFAIFCRLVESNTFGDINMFPGKTTLADVYKEARKYGWKAAPIAKRKRRNFNIPPPSYDY